jgi:hypothetical protein
MIPCFITFDTVVFNKHRGKSDAFSGEKPDAFSSEKPALQKHYGTVASATTSQGFSAADVAI